ncbi:MAG: hypothetical protein Q4B22_07375 [Eubacteriales bacterium]|nr:hypothetical protein [Eubacteriales bacterium]
MAAMTPEQFREKLQQILEIAEGQNGKIRQEQVSEALKDSVIAPEQMHLVYDFLLSRKIVVEGYEKETEKAEDAGEMEEVRPWSDAEQRWLDTYLEDLDGLRPEKEGEWDRLMHGVMQGDALAKRRMAELFLPEAAQLACSLYVKGVLLADIVQEGSLLLVLGIDMLESGLFADREAVRESLLRDIREGIQAMIEEQRDVHARDRKMVEKVEDLKDGVETLKEEYGRKIYLDEVADFMSITEEEAVGILRLAGEEVPDDPDLLEEAKQTKN